MLKILLNMLNIFIDVNLSLLVTNKIRQRKKSIIMALLKNSTANTTGKSHCYLICGKQFVANF
jgi:hypothetical protein